VDGELVVWRVCVALTPVLKVVRRTNWFVMGLEVEVVSVSAETLLVTVRNEAAYVAEGCIFHQQ
jgi:hypothetical protein